MSSLFGFLPNNLYTAHRGQNTSGLSPRLWGQLTGSMMASDGYKRLYLAGEDFGVVESTDTYTQVHADNFYTSYISTGATFKQLVDETAGAIAIASDGTDNDEVWMQTGSDTCVLGMISDPAHASFITGNDALTVFEIRAKKTLITDSGMSIFAGLCEVGKAAAAVKSDDAGLMGDFSFVGFDSTETAGETLNFTYHKNGDTDNGGTIAVAAGTMEADTWFKAGFIFNPNEVASKRIKVYFNNVELGTYVTAADIASTTTGALFPDAVMMQALFGGQAGGAAVELDIDWWAYAQLLP